MQQEETEVVINEMTKISSLANSSALLSGMMCSAILLYGTLDSGAST